MKSTILITAALFTAGLFYSHAITTVVIQLKPNLIPLCQKWKAWITWT